MYMRLCQAPNSALNGVVKEGLKKRDIRSTTEYLPWYSYKAEIHRYLAELNKNKKVCFLPGVNSLASIDLKQVLEYTLFQPGLFANYLTRPYKSSTYLHQIETA
ncbi:hypothetical protein BJX63DRAFT_431204 [Aspergillus granulosus]|uniref:Uncharacterized protein n=1 Tax=Aspergillus granulosus TaxID=176169 RepID=A0ABR4HHL3_9EURO